MTEATNKTVLETRKAAHERLEMIRGGDISQAVRAAGSLFQSYTDMAGRFNECTRVCNNLITEMKRLNSGIERFKEAAPIQREACVAANNALAQFSHVASREMVDCVRAYVAKVEDEIGADGESEVVDDARFAALLTRIESADPMTAMVMTRKAHQGAIECIRRLEDKVAGMKLKTTQRGATGPEAETAAAMILRFERIVEVARGRDNIIRERNRSICAAIRTEVDKNEVSEVKKVKLTKAQKKALEEMK